MTSLIKKALYKLLRKLEATEQKSQLSDSIKLGDGSILLSDSKIDFRTDKEQRTYVNIGEKCLIKCDFVFETKDGLVEIGKNVHIGGAMFICRTNIKVEDDVTMAWGITLYDHNSHSIYWEHRKNDNVSCYNDYVKFNGNNIVNKDWSNVISKPITIKSKVWIGYDVTILKGVTVGEGAVIGAKSVITKDIPAWSVAAGNPARVVKMLR